MILIGASGHGKVVADILMLSGEKEIIFWDDNPLANITGYPVMYREHTAQENVILCIGNNATRKQIAESASYTYKTAIHPSAILSGDVLIGTGSVVMAGAIINPGSKIGKHCIVNTAAIIEHDAMLADYIHISPNATLAGNVIVREGAWVGAGATVIQGITLGCWSVVGAGSVVIKDVPDYAVVVGNPARVIRYNNSVK